MTSSWTENSFDIVLMDRHMPHVDGLQATRRIRELSGPAGETPVVALTASVTAADRAECIEAPLRRPTLALTIGPKVPKSRIVYASTAGVDTPAGTSIVFGHVQLDHLSSLRPKA